jgi:hypothetical protein
MQALAPTSYATLAMAAARWAMWRASKGPERETTPQSHGYRKAFLELLCGK